MEKCYETNGIFEKKNSLSLSINELGVQAHSGWGLTRPIGVNLAHGTKQKQNLRPFRVGGPIRSICHYLKRFQKMKEKLLKIITKYVVPS